MSSDAKRAASNIAGMTSEEVKLWEVKREIHLKTMRCAGQSGHRASRSPNWHQTPHMRLGSAIGATTGVGGIRCWR